MKNPSYWISELTRINSARDEPTLDFKRITATRGFDDFEALQNHVLGTLRIKRISRSKAECFGWTASAFNLGERIFNPNTPREYREFGRWRCGAQEIDSGSVAVFDVDNHLAESPVVSVEKFERDLREVLQELSYFTYTSFSDAPDLPRFRVVMDTTRSITRAENLKIAIVLDAIASAGQSDKSIYDPSDFVYAPVQWSTSTTNRGQPIDVDQMLEVFASDPIFAANLAAIKTAIPPPVRCEPTAAQKSAVWTLQETVRKTYGVSIHNEHIWNPAWNGLYGAPGTSHWETMRSLLCKVWLKSGSTLTYGDMENIADEIDETGGYYWRQKYTPTQPHKLTNLINAVMTGVIATPPKSNPQYRHMHQNPDTFKPSIYNREILTS